MPRPSRNFPDRLAWFRRARFGMFIHWGLYAIPARGEWVQSTERISNDDYHAYFHEFNPTRCDFRAWARLARAAGQKYAVLTAKHHEGFCLFDSKLTNFKAPATPARRDLIREFVDAFRAEGLKVGLYYSLLDWHHPGYPAFGDHNHPLRDNDAYRGREKKLPQYVDYLHAQVRELLTNYGPIDLLWFDYSYESPQLKLKMSGDTWRAKELVAMIKKLQPHIILNNRLIAGHLNTSHANGDLGDIQTPEQLVPAEGSKNPDGSPLLWEACITMNDHWGYNPNDRNFKSPRHMIHLLVECVSKGGNLLLNVGPTAKGEIQPEFQRDLAIIGDWMTRNSDAIHGCSSAPLPKPDWGRYTLSADGKILYAHILDKPAGPLPVVGMGGKIQRARFLADGAEVNISHPWNVGANTTDLFLNISGPRLFDPIDTVIALELKTPLNA